MLIRARVRALARVLTLALLCIWCGHASAAGENWELFAAGQNAIVYLDRGSVSKAEEYVQYRVRVEYAQERETRDRRYRYRYAVNEVAAQCEAKKIAVISIALFDGAGVRLSGSARERERWAAALNDVAPGSVEDALMQHACALARGEEPPQPPKPRADAAPGKSTIGSGIVASLDGVVLTNHHVVDGCSAIVVVDADKKRAAAVRVASDPKHDLALLRVNRRFAEAATFRKEAPLQAGESVTVVGYPLASILGNESSVAFGYVSATSGLRGDAATFQISAPIHKGNSGGPILDQGGNVTGIVTAKLDAAAVQKRTGDLPQNISFGIKAEVAQLFLAAHNVRHASGAEMRKLENTEVAALGRAITVLVACRRGS
jgi:S1-C subfamily serine protease